MTGFRALLVAIFAILTLYTGVVMGGHGWNLLPVFFGDMRNMAWPGQFDLDFMLMLTLSALWMAWRHRFSPAGLGLALLAFFGGSWFLSLYLLVVSLRANGGMSEILLGRSRATVRA
jgi:hypothetical protein